MKSSDDSFEIEAVSVQSLTDQLRVDSFSSPYDTPSIALDNNNHLNIPRWDLYVPSLPGTDSTLEPRPWPVDSVKNSIQRPPRQALDIFQYYFHGFSLSTACIATRFGECSSTLLDKLWYLYSYIYIRLKSMESCWQW